MHIHNEINKLEELLSDLLLLVSQGAELKHVHTKIIKSLVIVEKLKSPSEPVSEGTPNEQLKVSEIRKVQRRLKLWARRPNQINHKILVAYLDLARSGKTDITESDLKKHMDYHGSFESNFVQMKNFSEKNHGKVFEQIGHKVKIWPPIEKYVHEFEQEVKGYFKK